MRRPSSFRSAFAASFIALCVSLPACSAILGIGDLPEGVDAVADGSADTNADGTSADGSVGTDGGTADGRASDGSSDGASDDSGDATTIEDCGSFPTLHPVDASSGPFCPFQDAGSSFCASGQYCCMPPASGGVFPPSECVNAGAGGANPCGASAVAVQCADENQCNGSNGGTTCCATGTAIGCGTLASFTGTKCSASCAFPLLPVCEAQAVCDLYDSRTVCTAFKAKGINIGACVIP